MPTSKKVMIACVSFETVKVVQPAIHYDVDEIHLFHMGMRGVYKEFYDEVCDQLLKNKPSISIEEHNQNIMDFSELLRSLLNLVDSLKKCDVLINVSAGPSEFIAAGVIASHMSKGVTSFTVSSSEYTVKDPSIYYVDGKPVGMASAVLPPVEIPPFNIERYPDDVVAGLKRLHFRREHGLSVTAMAMIEDLKENGIWNYTLNDSCEKTDIKQKETMYYQRHFVTAWAENGWIDKSNRKVKYLITPVGKSVLKIFCDISEGSF
ncbi:MAG: DUF6293 family protein [archaeon]|nr:DUF6293 family protein [archaeon]